MPRERHVRLCYCPRCCSGACETARAARVALKLEHVLCRGPRRSSQVLRKALIQLSTREALLTWASSICPLRSVQPHPTSLVMPDVPEQKQPSQQP